MEANVQTEAACVRVFDVSTQANEHRHMTQELQRQALLAME